MNRIAAASLPFLLTACSVIPGFGTAVDLAPFGDSARHWYAITDEVPKLITPLPDHPVYGARDVRDIAENVLLFQKSNGGWPKNYDMAAVLSPEQRAVIVSAKDDVSLTTFDNGATHSHIAYLAQANRLHPDERYRAAVERGVGFILSAQYPNGGFPQFHPDTAGYRKHITFNDGAMMGVVRVLADIADGKEEYGFIGAELRTRVNAAFSRAVDCILRCQVVQEGTLTAWGQQHDRDDLTPQDARTFEPRSLCSMESAEIVLWLMSRPDPDPRIIAAVNGAAAWYRRIAIRGVRVVTVQREHEQFMYHAADDDRIAVPDSAAPRIWTRLYELGTDRPLFCRRDGRIVYSLAEVERERRTGYKWYGYEPEEVLERHRVWAARWSPDNAEER